MWFFSALKNPFIEEGGKKWDFKIYVSAEKNFFCLIWKEMKSNPLLW